MEGLECVHLCEYVLVDKANKLSLLGEFTSVFFKEFPGTMPVLYVATRWSGPIGATFTETITIEDEGGGMVARSSIPLVEFKTDRITSVHKFELVRLPKPGQFSVRVFRGDALAGKERFFARSQGE